MEMDGGGFEPPKQFAADLQSVPFGHSGTHPDRHAGFTHDLSYFYLSIPFHEMQEFFSPL